MFRAQKRRTLERTNFGKQVIREQDYPDRLNLYSVPPLAEITLDQFEEWALDRLRVLCEIESCLFRNRNLKATEQAVKPVIDKYLPLTSNSTKSQTKSSQLDYERKKDHYSHYILRLAFCRSDELRHRFVKAESILFRIRYLSCDLAEQQAFLLKANNNQNWTSVADNEKEQLKELLAAATSMSIAAVEQEPFFAVDFEKVPDLVENRRVLLRYGQAYIPASQQLTLVLSDFAERLQKELEITARALPRLDEDDRLVPILNHLSRGFVAPEYVSDSSANLAENGRVTPEQVDRLVSHFPLCMKSLHDGLRQEKHLRYHGRQQYGLFLKGIGMTVDDALLFWRQSFSKISDEKFNKEYRYNIRHNYGLEGNRRNYKPFSCMQIISSNAPGPLDRHGCPYRHYSMENLMSALGGMGIHDKNTLKMVREDVEAKQYHVACTRVFEATHSQYAKPNQQGPILQETITHPNLYFDRSTQIVRNHAKAEISKEEIELKA
ncbi:eukaryotic and archaeal DNA primase, large subunit-domain-containing protein [Dipodascopsis uninucleata]